MSAATSLQANLEAIIDALNTAGVSNAYWRDALPLDSNGAIQYPTDDLYVQLDIIQGQVELDSDGYHSTLLIQTACWARVGSSSLAILRALALAATVETTMTGLHYEVQMSATPQPIQDAADTYRAVVARYELVAAFDSIT